MLLPGSRAQVLCVDDEPMVLEGLTLHLRRRYEVVTRTRPADALETIRGGSTFAVILSDMRMPGMDGATFLAETRKCAPDAVRMLLTGQADLQSAIDGVNKGQLFRFLLKPCSPDNLLAAFQAAVEQHRLLTAEKVLLEETLRGSVKALTELLSLSAPSAFGRAMRLARLAAGISQKMGGEGAWAVEVAAMLCEVGTLTLAPPLADKLIAGEDLAPAERAIVDGLPAVAVRLLGHIPRLEAVLDIIKFHRTNFDASTNARGIDGIPIGARILRVAVDFDALDTRGPSTAVAMETMRGRAGRYDPAVIEALVGLVGASTETKVEVRELPIKAVALGMTFVEDVRTKAGAVFIARGFEVNASLLERVKNLAPGYIREPVRVSVRPGG